METRYKLYIAAVCAFFIVVAAAFSLGRAYTRTRGSTGGQQESAADINRQIAGEQQRALSGVRSSTDSVTEGLERLERIRSITAETDTALNELGQLNRGSGDIYEEIKKELDILENYFRSVSSVISSSDNKDGD